MNSNSRGFALVEMMVVCAILGSVLYVLFSANTSVTDTIDVNQRAADVTHKTQIGHAAVASFLRPASISFLEVRSGSTWIAPIDGTAYEAVRFREPAALPNGGPPLLKAPRSLEFVLDAGETQNGVDDDHDGLIDEGRIWLTERDGSRSCLAGSVTTFTIAKVGHALDVTLQCANLDAKRRTHRASSVQRLMLRNN